MCRPSLPGKCLGYTSWKLIWMFQSWDEAEYTSVQGLRLKEARWAYLAVNGLCVTLKRDENTDTESKSGFT